MLLGKLLLAIYFFSAEDSQREISRHLSLNPNLVSSIWRRLQDACSRDLQERPITPFGGPGTVVKCDESKFNHKSKVKLFLIHDPIVSTMRRLPRTSHCKTNYYDSDVNATVNSG